MQAMLNQLDEHLHSDKPLPQDAYQLLVEAYKYSPHIDDFLKKQACSALLTETNLADTNPLETTSSLEQATGS